MVVTKDEIAELGILGGNKTLSRWRSRMSDSLQAMMRATLDYSKRMAEKAILIAWK